MTGMPYNFETGPTFEVFEDIMNGAEARLIGALNDLRDPAQPLADIIGLDSSTLNVGPRATFAARKKQVNEDWLGMHDDSVLGWQPQPPFSPTNRTTGRWTSWYGDADGIVRTTLQRAAEVSLGIDPRGPIVAGAAPGTDGAPVTAAETTQHWPVILIWKCGQSWFEGWISWRKAGDSGLVVGILATPGNGDRVSRSPLAPPNRSYPEYAEYPSLGANSASSAGKARGHWVVGHKHNQPHLAFGSTTAAGQSGDVQFPSLLTVWEGEGDIVTVAPSEPDGGVLAGGLPWAP